MAAYDFMKQQQAPTASYGGQQTGGYKGQAAPTASAGPQKWSNGGQIDNSPSQTQDQWAQQYAGHQAQAQQAYSQQAQSQAQSNQGGGTKSYNTGSTWGGVSQTQPQASTGGDGTKYLARGSAAPTASASAAPAGTGGYRGMSSGVDDPGGRGNTTAPPSTSGWQQGPTVSMSQGSTPQPGPNIGNTPSQSYGGYGGSSGGNQSWSPSADYQNPDGSWHQNAQYGQQGSNIGQGPQRPQQTSGESGPAQQWGLGGAQAGNPARNLPTGKGVDWNAFMPSQNQGNYGDDGFVRSTSSLNNATLPFLNAAQNAYQYQHDADTSDHRFDLQYQQTGQNNAFQQGLSTRQQDAAEQQAALAGNQWAIAHNDQNINDDRNFGLQQQGQMNSNNQFNSQLAAQNSQFQQTYGLQAQGQAQQYGLQQQQMDLSQVQNTQQYGLQQSQLHNQIRNDTRNYGLNVRGADLADLQNSQQYGLQQSQFGLQQLQNSQQYGLDTRGMTVQEQAQAAQAAYQQGQLGQGTRSLDLQQWQQEQGMDLQNRTLAQQLQMQQAQLAQAKEASYMAATGHNQKPNARWLRAS